MFERGHGMGLSPRVRGNHHRRARRGELDRSIPACAGEPIGRRPQRRPCGVYPRVCGGTALASGDHGPVPGLSPRVRGNQPRGGDSGHCVGSIPACAGEPPAPRLPRGFCRVYPRVCGGTEVGPSRLPLYMGLSPRVRGNPLTGTDAGSFARSIPACAGEPRDSQT